MIGNTDMGMAVTPTAIPVDRREERLALASEALGDLIWDVDLATGSLTIEGRAGDLRTANSLEEWQTLMHPDDRETVRRSFARAIRCSTRRWLSEHRIQRVDGRYASVSERAIIVRDPSGEARRVVGVVQDVSDRAEAKRELERLATHDPLTGLANRTLLRAGLDAAIGLASAGRRLALLFMDLDRFKEVNDSHGHLTGDAVLKQVAARLDRSVRGIGMAARLGGDEFAVILEIEGGAETERLVRDRVLSAFENRFEVDGHELDVHASVGVAVFPTTPVDIETLLRRADRAMYAAKRTGTGVHMSRTQEDPYVELRIPIKSSRIRDERPRPLAMAQA